MSDTEGKWYSDPPSDPSVGVGAAPTPEQPEETPVDPETIPPNPQGQQGAPIGGNETPSGQPAPEVTAYKCPNCGAPISFAPASQMFDCPYCLSSFTASEFEDFTRSQTIHAERQEEKAEQNESQQVTDEHLRGYNCANCGAVVVTDDTTTATYCYYCHSPVIISDRLQGEFRPDLVLPFNLNREQAVDAFMKWARGKRYVPSDFAKQEHVDKLTGMYIPYWLVDGHARVNYEGSSHRARTWMVGRTQFTEHTRLQHVRQGIVKVNDISEIALTKINANALNGVFPYQLEALKPFQMPFLSGFFAESYDVAQNDVHSGLVQRIGQLADQTLDQSISSFGARDVARQIDVALDDFDYALLPAWTLTYPYKDKTYVFMVNGQNGNLYGELPLDNGKVRRDGLILGIVVLIIALIIGFII